MTHLQLASSREEVERPSNFELACRLLRDVLRMERHANFLWTNGRWQHATVDDIMKRANEHQKRAGRQQFKGKAVWQV